MKEMAKTLIRVLFAAILAAAAAVCWGSAAASASTVAAAAVPAASSPVVSTPSPGTPADACTVTVGGEKKHGRSDGSSWCCLNKGTIHEQCWSCTTYTCSDGWNLMGPGGGDIKEFETI